MKKKIISIAGAIITLAALVSICFGVTNYFAKDSEFKEFRAEYYQDKDMQRLQRLQERVWQLKDYYLKNPPMPFVHKKEVMMLELEIEELKKKIYKKKG